MTSLLFVSSCRREKNRALTWINRTCRGFSDERLRTVSLALASQCPRIVSKRFLPRAPSPSSARRRARHRLGVPCSKIFSAAGFLARSTWSTRATTRSRESAPSNPTTRCRKRPTSSLSRCRRLRYPMRLPPPRAKAPQSASSLPQGSAMAPARSPMPARRTPAPPACAWSAPIVSACWCLAQSSMRASRRRRRRPAILRSSRNPAPSRLDWCNGLPAVASAFPPSSRSAIASTWTSPTCSITSLWIAARGPSYSISNWSRTRANSCRRRAPRHAPSRCW